jgi:hypothetical protein
MYEAMPGDVIQFGIPPVYRASPRKYVIRFQLILVINLAYPATRR